MFKLVALKATECDYLKVIGHYAFDKGLYGDLERASDMCFFPDSWTSYCRGRHLLRN